jgi:GNAT superfamily N-acetyltransferase
LKVIRPEPHHVFEWVELVKEFLSEGIHTYNWGISEDNLHTTYHLWNKDFGFLLEDEGKIVGVLAGSVAPHFFNYSNIFFQENMWYVRKEFRRKGGGILLYRALVRRCRERGIRRIVFGHTKIMKNEFEKLYGKLGLTYLESHYEKVL